MSTNVSERIHTLQDIRRIIAILAVAGVVKDTADHEARHHTETEGQ
ncbi:MAG: hypothetical protein MR570_03325 [Bifidobacterium pseudolongum]|nr:hypothetical protein [Bifidobacterium pseudolongum]